MIYQRPFQGKVCLEKAVRFQRGMKYFAILQNEN
jgi:hypothetical protein